jgi:2-oxoisovalerate dehydrogenase E1 component beta subunit
LRPVVEMQFDAFSYPAFEQITSHLAKLRNRSRGHLSLPIVIRVPFGGGIGGVEHHSDSSEAYWVHTPGLRVVTPSSASDAYWLLRQAIDSDDPVLFFEPKRRYWAKEEISLSPAADFDSALIRRTGTDVTLIGYGAMVGTLMESADAAAEDGISAEVIDVRSLTPFDDVTIAASVRRTGRAVVVHEASGFAGFGAEIVARLTEQCFHHLHAPIGRVTGFDIPYPPPMLEAHHLPSVDRILDAIDRLQFDDTVVS